MRVGKEEISEAKKYDVLSYLMRANPSELKKSSSNEYCLKTHDSFKISNGLWYWYSQNIGGRTAIDYLIKVRGFSFPNAVVEVNSVMRGNPSFFVPQKEDKEFKLPEKNENNDIAFDYLCKRGIDKTLIEELMKKGKIFENKKYHSVIFVGTDNKGKPVYANYRSTTSNLKGEFRGSDKYYSFRFENKNSRTVRVFESAIDMLSYITLCINSGKEFGHESYISTGGISAAEYTDEYKIPRPLERYLEEHCITEKIILQLDNDKTGLLATENIKRKLGSEYEIEVELPQMGKDFNEYLLMNKEKEEREMSEGNVIEVIKVEAGKEAKVIKIKDDLKSMQEVVDGYIEEYMPFEDDVAIVCNEEGKVAGLPLNRAIYDKDNKVADIIAGTFFLTYSPIDSEKYCSIPDGLKEKYLEKFRLPERFNRSPNGIEATKYVPQKEEMER